MSGSIAVELAVIFMLLMFIFGLIAGYGVGLRR